MLTRASEVDLLEESHNQFESDWRMVTCSNDLAWVRSSGRLSHRYGRKSHLMSPAVRKGEEETREIARNDAKSSNPVRMKRRCAYVVSAKRREHRNHRWAVTRRSKRGARFAVRKGWLRGSLDRVDDRDRSFDTARRAYLAVSLASRRGARGTEWGVESQKNGLSRFGSS